MLLSNNIGLTLGVEGIDELNDKRIAANEPGVGSFVKQVIGGICWESLKENNNFLLVSEKFPLYSPYT